MTAMIVTSSEWYVIHFLLTSFLISLHFTSSQYHYLNFVFNVKYHFPSFHTTQEGKVFERVLTYEEYLAYGMKGRKRYTCHSDDSDEDSDQEESDDGDGKKDHQFCT